MKKFVSCLLVLCTFLTIMPISAFALSWDGSSAGGTGAGSAAGANGYAIRTSSDNCVGYRFSVVNSSGANKVTKVIDVFRGTDYGKLGYTDGYKFASKYNKKQLMGKQNNNFSTSKNTTNCYKEADMNFSTALPKPSGMGTWQQNENNINRILSTLGVVSTANMDYGDMVIVEPLYDVRLQSTYHSITVTEIALYGKYILGSSSDGGSSSTPASWGFISGYTNRIYPNELFTPDGQGLWTGVSALTSRETFYNIINKGYGVGIAYKETTVSTYTIKFYGNGSTSGTTAAMTMTYGTAKNLTANGFVKTGNKYVKWNTKADGTGTSYTNQQSVKNLTTGGGTVNLYAQWSPNTLKVTYNANGGALDSSSYYLSSGNVYTNSTNTLVTLSWTYNVAKANGLHNASTFGLYRTGYTFNQWQTSASGGTVFDQDNASLKPTDINSGITSGDVSTKLYAKWTPNTYNIVFNGNENTGGSTASMTMTYDVAKNLTANGFSKTGYYFAGWNTKSDGSGTGYYNQQSVKNLTTTNGATITLYAQWSVNSYTVAFNGNGATSGTTSSMTIKFDESKNLSANGYNRTGYSFKNWNTKANGSGTSYSDKQSVKNLSSTNGATVYLYAQWTPNSYTINFNGNGNTSGSTESMSMTYGTAKNLTANGFVKTGYIFSGWNTAQNGSGTKYTNKQSVNNLVSTNGGGITLYAQWQPITYTIVFNGNGATSGATTSMSMTYDTAKNLTANGFVKTNYKYLKWTTNANGTGTSYTDKQSVKNLTTVNGTTVNLYAQWEYEPNLAVNECDVYDGAKNNKKQMYGISRGNVFDDYEYKTDYPTIGDTVWFNVYFPVESQSITVRQYVKNGGNWITRDVTLSSSNTSSQWFPVQFSGKYMTVDADTNCYTVQARTDWIDANGEVLKSGTVHTFYIPIKPVVYRNQVYVYDCVGSTFAYNGTDGSKGAIYSGQHVRFNYKFTADNSWNAIEQLRASAYNYSGTAWEAVYKGNSGWDAVSNKSGVSSKDSVTLQSVIGTYTVPKTTQGKMRFKLTSVWSLDTDHTTETTWIDLPVLPTDVAITQILLYDADTGRKLDPLNLEAGQKVRVVYIYKNNTNAQIYIECYTSDKQKVSGVYSIPANSSASMQGKSFVVPNQRNFTLWGGVYLEGMGIYNTEYETDGTNNALTLQCKVNHPLKLIPIAQNADYREGTDVITSFWLNNTYTDEYTPNDSISVKFNVYKNSTLIKTVTKTQVVVPGNEMNLLYFKWRVPSGLSGADVRITGEIIDGGVSYNRATASYSTTASTISDTPDTQFTKKAPTGYTIPNAPTQSNGSAVWWEWTYSNGSFRKINYGIAISPTKIALTPATGESAVKSDNVWTMKSGYALSLSVNNSMIGVSGYSTPTSSSYTLPQYAIATFPEFGYSTQNSKYRTLTISSNVWSFPQNGSYGKVHYTPLWFPNGNYVVNVVKSDCWTPAGMIKRSANSSTICINESVYDDWYVGRN